MKSKLLHEWREILRYRIDMLFSRGAPAQFLVLTLLVLLVTAFGMVAYFFGLFSAENADVQGIRRDIDAGFWDSLWWSLKHVLNVRHFDRNYGATVPIVVFSFFISLMGMIIFGFLIGLISTAFGQRLDELKRGNSAVKERGHVLILGWSRKVVAILRHLATSQPRTTVVILAPRGIEEMQEALRLGGIERMPVRVILRSGSTSKMNELERVAFHSAAQIVVLTHHTDGTEVSDRDGEVIKALMILSTFEDWRGPRPTITAEIEEGRNVESASIAVRERSPIVCSTGVVSKIIVQCARYRGLSAVLDELLSDHGSELYVRKFPECDGKTMREVAGYFTDTIPIGIMWEEERDGVTRYAAGLNPEPDYDLDAEEQLILVARDEKIVCRPAALSRTTEPVSVPPAETATSGRIVVVGWNGNLIDVLSELDGHCRSGTRVDVVSSYSEDGASRRLRAHFPDGFTNLNVKPIEGDSIGRASIRALDMHSAEAIILLADDSHGDSDPDSRTIRVLLVLSDVLEEIEWSRRPRVIAELLDPASRDVLAGLRVDDLIVSSQVVSMVLAQISHQEVLGCIYHELLSAGGIEISLKPVERYVEPGTTCSFADLVNAAQDRMEIALGVYPAEQRAGTDSPFQLNPGLATQWTLEQGDRVIALSQQIYR